MKSLFNKMVESMKDFDKSTNSINESTNPIKKENNELPSSILDHKVFDLFTDIGDNKGIYHYNTDNFTQEFKGNYSYKGDLPDHSADIIYFW